MMRTIPVTGRHTGPFARAAMALSAMMLICAPLASHAQITPVDPNEVIDADLDGTPPPPVPVQQGDTTYYEPVPSAEAQTEQPQVEPPVAEETVSADATVAADADIATAPPAPVDKDAVTTAAANETYQDDDLIGAAEGVFGKGAEGLAKIIEDVLDKQGKPSAYIVGREAGGAFVVGVRYGSGTLFHKVEGQRNVYWTGPSIGFDAGGNAAQTFTLVYNLHDSQDLYKRFPAGEGAAYLVGGFTASYVRRGDIVLVPIRLGVGARLGVNVGWISYSEKQRWLPL